MTFPLGMVPVTLAVSVIWVGRTCFWATKASAAAKPELPLVPDAVVALPAPPDAVVALPAPTDAVVGEDDDLELLLQAASSKAITMAPTAANVELRRRFGPFQVPAGLFTFPPPQRCCWLPTDGGTVPLPGDSARFGARQPYHHKR